MKVYLAGHIPKTEETDWRKELIEEFWTIKERIRSNKGIVPRETVDLLIPDNIDYELFQVIREVRHEATATRDHKFLNECDVAVVNLDLNLGKCLGATYEFGYLRAMHTPIVLINHHPDMPRTKFLEHNADIVVTTIRQAAEIILYMVI